MEIFIVADELRVALRDILASAITCNLDGVRIGCHSDVYESQ